MLYERINELEHLIQREIDLVMPNPYRLVNEIQGQVINQLISEGDVVTATFTATAAAGTEGMEKEE